ncbi:MAG: hydroxyethylthiazole kinase [Oscillospiraceae bacterium]|nr:hydroxyethylthiazole kinase [Oscillospiraceae bacterium]
MHQVIHDICKTVKQMQPLIHCITNPISINQCANGILAIGARPMMAEHPKEVPEITRTAQALMLNLGNITDARMESMRISAKTANEMGIPVLLDAVGISCSSLRREYVKDLLNTAVPTVIKGNYSEIQALYRDSYRSSGVDADSSLDIHTIDHAAISLARSLGAVILASGKVDIVTNGKHLYHIHNGTPLLSQVTGTGCLQGALCASFLSAKPGIEAVMTGCSVLGICGELAQTDRGTGTFLCSLMDKLSTLTDAEIEQNLKMEEITIEEI